MANVVGDCAAHNVFHFNDVTFSSNFDNGNLARVEQVPNKSYDFKVWTAPDNMGSAYQSKHCAWYFFMVTGLPQGCVLRIQIVNAANHAGLYKYDMRPVYRSNATNQKWLRIKSSVRFSKDTSGIQLFFEHGVETADDKLFFAFTYPYTYTMVQNELAQLDSSHSNQLDQKGSIFYQRELVTQSLDGRRIDLLTISSVDGMSATDREPLLPSLFPEARKETDRVPVFPEKEIVFVSARVHSGEVPAQHTFKGILNLLMDPTDLRAKELRARYVFKLIPMLNPDGVYRGHFRMDQLGQNLNRYYLNSDALLQPAVFAARSLTDYFASLGKLSVYLDFHAHASKRGCFIYGNVLDTAEDQIQNQLYCKLIAMNSAHFDYEGCLFSKDHMTRIDPGDQAKGLTAEGSGRVSMYLTHKMIHSYTIECNYNTSRVGNEIAPPDSDPCGQCVSPASAFTTNPEKYTPSVYAGVGRACVIALLDIRGHNPCSRLSKSKFKTLDRVRNSVMMEVRSRREYIGKAVSRDRRRPVIHSDRKVGDVMLTADDICWRRTVESTEAPPAAATGPTPPTAPTNSQSAKVNSNNGTNSKKREGDRSDELFFIPMKEVPRRRRSISSGGGLQPTAPAGARPSDSGGGRSMTPRTATQQNQRAAPQQVAAGVVPNRGPPQQVGDHIGVPAPIPRVRRGTEVPRAPSSSEISRGSSQASRVSQQSPLTSDFSVQPDARSSPLDLGIAGSSTNLAVRELSLHQPATSMLFPTNRQHPPSSAPAASTAASSSSSSAGASSNVVHNTSSVKSGRNNILGKKLHAAGVALLMGSASSFESIGDAIEEGRAERVAGSQNHSNHHSSSGVSGAGMTAAGLPSSVHSVGDALDSLTGLLPHRAHTIHTHTHSHLTTHEGSNGAHDLVDDALHAAAVVSPRATSAGAYGGYGAYGVRGDAREKNSRPGGIASALDEFGSLTLDEVRRDNYSLSADYYSSRVDSSRPPEHALLTSPIKSIRSPKQSPC